MDNHPKLSDLDIKHGEVFIIHEDDGSKIFVVGDKNNKSQIIGQTKATFTFWRNGLGDWVED